MAERHGRYILSRVRWKFFFGGIECTGKGERYLTFSSFSGQLPEDSLAKPRFFAEP